ncbi:10117_t:CDS:2 [Gigaspora margarita]|uniref:10117_t:CDS:1 n=1 Tax=Gigaspora margarita TaxID=4874 RepID=A0ABN7US75_GIGMA|nr:10117_t:CDS:2 [Gigaspora margarita]
MNLQFTISSVIDSIIKYSKQPLDSSIQRRQNRLSKKYDKIVVFGDSFSDTGNVYSMTPKQLPSMNFEGRFCDGKVWSEYLAELLDVELVNYAIGGASSDKAFTDHQSDVPGLKQQVQNYISNRSRFENCDRTLFVLWTMGQDYIISNYTASPKSILTNIASCVSLLINHLGATHILIPGIPDLSQSPLHKNDSDARISLIKTVCKSHNQALKNFIDLLKKIYYHINIHNYDTANELEVLKEEALNQDWEKVGEKLLELPKKPSLQRKLEIKNVRDEFINPYDGSISGDLEGEYFTPEKYFYWDLIHWSSKVHEVVADDLFELVR